MASEFLWNGIDYGQADSPRPSVNDVELTKQQEREIEAEAYRLGAHPRRNETQWENVLTRVRRDYCQKYVNRALEARDKARAKANAETEERLADERRERLARAVEAAEERAKAPEVRAAAMRRQIREIKNRDERIAAIAENIELFE